jgi:carbonic anhydrase
LHVKRHGFDMRRDAPIIAPAVEAGRVKVVAAVYDLSTGQVTLVG